MRSSDSREAPDWIPTFGVVLGAVQRSPVTCHPGLSILTEGEHKLNIKIAVWK